MNTIIDNLLNLDILNKLNMNGESNNNIVENKNNHKDNHDHKKNDNNHDKNNFFHRQLKESSLEYTKHKYDKSRPNPSLEQGYKFKKYQNKITSIVDNKHHQKNEKKNNNYKEGYANGYSNGNVNGTATSNTNTKLAQETDSLLKTINARTSTSQQASMAKLKEEYNETLNQYSELMNQISQNYTDYATRESSNNPYLNKYIRFSSGQICYVTNKGIVKYIPNNFLNDIAGKNGCPSASSTSGFIDINIPWSNDYNIQGTQIPTTPPLIVGTSMQKNESCGKEGGNIFVNSMLSNPTSKYVGCYQDNATNPAMTFIGGAPNANASSNGKYNYTQCQQSAVMGGYQFFALQNVNSTTGLGYCAVSNSQSNSTQYGNAYISVPLWASNTSGTSATYAILTNLGTLSLRDGNGNVYYTTPNSSPDCNQIYSTTTNTDAPGNDLGFYSNQSIASCKTLCDNNPSCGGFVFNTSNNNSCWTKSSNLDNKGKNSARTIYKKTRNTSQCVFFLSLQSDGNMVINKGVPNSQSTTQIWSTNTNGKQQENNNNYVSSKGKYGVPFITTNQILNKGEWVSSLDGNLLLIMQNDGNLVLYSFKTNCSKTSNVETSTYNGGALANALYNVGSVGVNANMGQVAYIDADSQIYPYPSSNVKYSSTYSTILQNFNIPGNVIPGAAVNSNNVNDCMAACNKLDNCNSFVYDTSGPSAVCFPKNVSNIYSGNAINAVTPNNNITTYIRDKTAIQLPSGVSDKVNNVDSIQYQNYTKGQGDMQTSYGFSNVLNASQKHEIKQLQDKLKQLSLQISNTTNQLISDNKGVNEQMKKDLLGFSEYISENDVVNQKIRGFNVDNNLDNILNDTNIKILQQNYSYMVWSILAAAVIIIAINIKNSAK